MGDFKPLLPWADGVLLDAALGAARGAGCRVILVTGCRGEELEARYGGADGVALVRNDDWERGMAGSVRRGAALVRTERFFVAHADMPLLTPELYRALNSSYLAAASPAEAAAPAVSAPGGRPLVLRPRTANGHPGHPVLFGSGARPLIAAAEDGESLKPVLARCDLRLMDTPDEDCAQDADELPAYLDLLLRRGSAAPQPGVEAAPEPTLAAVSGLPGSGKTTELRRRFFRALARGIPSFLASQVQVGRRDGEGRARAFDLELISWEGTGSVSLRRVPLARRAENEAAADPSVFTLALGPFLFDPRAFAEALGSLSIFLERTEGAAAGRFLALDEIGRLELERRGGLRPALELALDALRRDRAAGAPSALACAARLDTLEVFRNAVEAEGCAPEVLVLRAGLGPQFLDQPLQG